MNVNQTPTYDKTDNPTGCCPRFKPQGWDEQELHFENKPFVLASTLSLLHLPLNMSHVFAKTQSAIEKAHAEGGGFLVLTSDQSPWHAEHLFAVDHVVPGAEMVYLSGTFLTKVFEGPFPHMQAWLDELRAFVESRGKTLETPYFFFTTCPRCAKVYGKNYVVGVAKVR